VHVKRITDTESFFPENHEILKYFNEILVQFHTDAGTNLLSVSLMFGVKDLSRKGLSRWDQNNLGTVVWDRSFTMAPKENQIYMDKFCADLM